MSTTERIVPDKTDRWPPNSAGETLTRREAEVAGLVSLGLPNRAVAEQLMIQEGTVKIHLHNIYRKLCVSGRAGLIVRSQFAANTPEGRSQWQVNPRKPAFQSSDIG